MDIRDSASIKDSITGTMASQSVLNFSDGKTEARSWTITKPPTGLECVACMDLHPRTNTVTTPCGHHYCADCVTRLFMCSTKDEGLYPPQCCKRTIPLVLVATCMDSDQLAAFELASIEFTTRHRVYCSNTACGRFVVPQNIDLFHQRADCSHCKSETCPKCRGAYHYGSACPEDLSVRQTRELAHKEGWQTCPSCDRVVDLSSGCYHMT
jgi:hypothetical protein